MSRPIAGSINFNPGMPVKSKEREGGRRREEGKEKGREGKKEKKERFHFLILASALMTKYDPDDKIIFARAVKVGLHELTHALGNSFSSPY